MKESDSILLRCVQDIGNNYAQRIQGSMSTMSDSSRDASPERPSQAVFDNTQRSRSNSTRGSSPDPSMDDEGDEDDDDDYEEEPPYTPEEIAAFFVDFYEFLTNLHYDRSHLKLAPPEGWPNMPPEGCQTYKSDLVVEVLQRLPYFDNSSQAQFHHRSALRDWTVMPREVWESNDPLEDNYLNQGEDQPTREQMAFIAEGFGRNGIAFILIPRTGEIDKEDFWSMEGPYSIEWVFAELKQKYLDLHLIPCLGRRTIDWAHKVAERAEPISAAEVRAQTQEQWGSDLDIQYLRQIYREHGWPHAFQKEAARQVVDAWMQKRTDADLGTWDEDD